MENILGITVNDIAFYNFKTMNVDGEEIIVSRTGYTGEDGFEVYGSHDFTRKVWDKAHEGECSLADWDVATPSVSRWVFHFMATN